MSQHAARRSTYFIDFIEFLFYLVDTHTLALHVHAHSRVDDMYCACHVAVGSNSDSACGRAVTMGRVDLFTCCGF